MNNYNFIPLSELQYQKSTFRVNNNTSIDITKLLISNEEIGKDKETYNVILSENSTNNNVVIGFYNSKTFVNLIDIEGGKQQATANFVIENGINYFVVSLTGKGKTISLYRLSTNKIFFINLT